MIQSLYTDLAKASVILVNSDSVPIYRPCKNTEAKPKKDQGTAYNILVYIVKALQVEEAQDAGSKRESINLIMLPPRPRPY